ncbi:MAG: cytochrome c oxidase subunit II [Candidatus Paracaedimonas acanthamoebae]|mgnify:FL=1|uniref:Cytochrome c oxidase subunit 2 n=1 Tax=Candidatus Paracaedimonas acanthamoebae TaxID=244581 RepID=A0A8J7PPG8_9PROT|nr:cytochrome c oxidase subunit II [Candidatus Paracaedimonas acanthamoebae]
MSLFISCRLFAKSPLPWQINLQEAATPVAQQIHSLHNTLLIVIACIALAVVFLLLYVVLKFRAKKNPIPSKTTHNPILEVVWTLVPAAILLGIAFPSFKLLYFMDRTHEPEMTLKVTGHQWYWSYEYPEAKISFDSYMIQDADLKPGQQRLLEVDHEIVVPIETNIRILVTSADVLHSWAMPALGIKQDTIPGRLRETWMRIVKSGTYYGQCSELCGVNHAFMPIKIRAVSKQEYEQWLREAKQKFTA